MRFLLVLILAVPQLAAAETIDRYRELSRYFTENKLSVGIAGTLFENGEFQDFTDGLKSLETGEAMDEHTFMELGSATKMFTGILLAREVVLGTLTLDQPVKTFFPQLDGKPTGDITLKELATHTSGLQRMPANLVDLDGGLSSYRYYTRALLLEYLREAPVGAKTYLYSNTGVALLAQILEITNGMSYAEMVEKFIKEPLGIEGLRAVWSDDLLPLMAAKYNSVLRPEQYWTDLNSMDGTGIIKITLAGLKKFLLAQLYPERLESPLKEAIPLAHQAFAEAEDFKIGLGWFQDTVNDVTYVNHNGSTEGFTTEFQFDPVAKRGMIYLNNTDLYSPGLCMIDLFTKGACEEPQLLPIPDESMHIGTYVARDGNNFIGFDVAKDSEHGFLYLEVFGDVVHRLFLRADGALAIDGDRVVLKFDENGNGAMEENWSAVGTYPFMRFTHTLPTP